MVTVGYVAGGSSLGFKTRRLRISLRLTRHDLAILGGVPLEEVGLLEKNMPVKLGTKLKILRVVWAQKVDSRWVV